MQAAFFRQIVARRCSNDQQGSIDKASNAQQQQQPQPQQHTAKQGTVGNNQQQQVQSCSKDQLDAMLAESLQYAKEDVKRFVDETQRAGWNVHPIMLSSNEKSTFSTV